MSTLLQDPYHRWQVGPMFHAVYQGHGAQRLALEQPDVFSVVAFSPEDRDEQVASALSRLNTP
ncbi:MAG: hypothetical protein JWN52_7208 [Actinomycetia bacterium]|nr:hypothetical protein [Actinomycetes bacterium]